jgi:hypothetical protein
VFRNRLVKDFSSAPPGRFPRGPAPESPGGALRGRESGPASICGYDGNVAATLFIKLLRAGFPADPASEDMNQLCHVPV